MTLKDIIELGKMGYNKKDIETLTQNEKIEDTSNSEEIEKLNAKIDELTQKIELNEVRKPRTDTPASENPKNSVEECLKNLAGNIGEIDE